MIKKIETSEGTKDLFTRADFETNNGAIAINFDIKTDLTFTGDLQTQYFGTAGSSRFGTLTGYYGTFRYRYVNSITNNEYFPFAQTENSYIQSIQQDFNGLQGDFNQIVLNDVPVEFEGPLGSNITCFVELVIFGVNVSTKNFIFFRLDSIATINHISVDVIPPNITINETIVNNTRNREYEYKNNNFNDIDGNLFEIAFVSGRDETDISSASIQLSSNDNIIKEIEIDLNDVEKILTFDSNQYQTTIGNLFTGLDSALLNTGFPLQITTIFSDSTGNKNQTTQVFLYKESFEPSIQLSLGGSLITHKSDYSKNQDIIIYSENIGENNILNNIFKPRTENNSKDKFIDIFLNELPTKNLGDWKIKLETTNPLGEQLDIEPFIEGDDKYSLILSKNNKPNQSITVILKFVNTNIGEEIEYATFNIIQIITKSNLTQYFNYLKYAQVDKIVQFEFRDNLGDVVMPISVNTVSLSTFEKDNITTVLDNIYSCFIDYYDKFSIDIIIQSLKFLIGIRLDVRYEKLENLTDWVNDYRYIYVKTVSDLETTLTFDSSNVNSFNNKLLLQLLKQNVNQTYDFIKGKFTLSNELESNILDHFTENKFLYNQLVNLTNEEITFKLEETISGQDNILNFNENDKIDKLSYIHMEYDVELTLNIVEGSNSYKFVLKLELDDNKIILKVKYFESSGIEFTEYSLIEEIDQNGVLQDNIKITLNDKLEVLLFFNFRPIIVIKEIDCASVNSDICFVKDTPINTDQGIINIQDIDTNINTIDNKKINMITTTKHTENHLVKIKKDSISKDVPNNDIILTKKHKILYKNELIESINLPNIEIIEYNSNDILYNILMDEHSTIIVNNLVAETLNPNIYISKMYNYMNTIKCNNEKINIINYINNRNRMIK